MVGNYVDGEAEGLSISTKRKKEMENKEENESPRKAIKLDIQETKEQVKEEPKSLLDAAEMDLDFDDTVAKEVERRSKRPQERIEFNNHKMLFIDIVSLKMSILAQDNRRSARRQRKNAFSRRDRGQSSRS